MELRRSLYQALPDELRDVAGEGYVLLAPTVSWRKWNRTEDEFVRRFFDDREEYRGYVDEFMGGRITDICGRAAAEADDDVVIWDAHREECERLYALIRKRRPEVLVETGVHHGVSTASMLVALEDNATGALHSVVDRRSGPTDGDQSTNPYRERGRPSCAEPGSHSLPPDREPGWIVPADLRERWDVRRGRRRRVLPALLAELGGIDLFLHDSEHSRSGMLFEFELAWEWLRQGGLMVSHHVARNDAFETFVEEHAADHGLMSYTYVGEHEIPCSSGYAIRR